MQQDTGDGHPRRPNSLQIQVPNYVWYIVMVHLDLRCILTSLMCLDVKTREYFRSLNSALFDIFLRNYGLCIKLRRTDIPGRIPLLPFLVRLETAMVRAQKDKIKADATY